MEPPEVKESVCVLCYHGFSQSQKSSADEIQQVKNSNKSDKPSSSTNKTDNLNDKYRRCVEEVSICDRCSSVLLITISCKDELEKSAKTNANGQGQFIDERLVNNFQVWMSSVEYVVKGSSNAGSLQTIFQELRMGTLETWRRREFFRRRKKILQVVEELRTFGQLIIQKAEETSEDDEAEVKSEADLEADTPTPISCATSSELPAEAAAPIRLDNIIPQDNLQPCFAPGTIFLTALPANLVNFRQILPKPGLLPPPPPGPPPPSAPPGSKQSAWKQRFKECTVCHKWIKNNQFKIHMRVHTGERPHVCTICKTGFRTSYDLTCHKRTHTGEKPYSCTICDAKFTTNSALHGHNKRRHPDKKTNQSS